MDVNETLRQIREIVQRETSRTGYVDPSQALDDLEFLAGMFENLDEWLTNGGFPPADWIGKSE